MCAEHRNNQNTPGTSSGTAQADRNNGMSGHIDMETDGPEPFADRDRPSGPMVTLRDADRKLAHGLEGATYAYVQGPAVHEGLGADDDAFTQMMRDVTVAEMEMLEARGKPLLYEHSSSQRLGKVTRKWMQNEFMWIEGELDLDVPLARTIVLEIMGGTRYGISATTNTKAHRNGSGKVTIEKSIVEVSLVVNPRRKHTYIASDDEMFANRIVAASATGDDVSNVSFTRTTVAPLQPFAGVAEPASGSGEQGKEPSAIPSPPSEVSVPQQPAMSAEPEDSAPQDAAPQASSEPAADNSSPPADDPSPAAAPSTGRSQPEPPRSPMDVDESSTGFGDFAGNVDGLFDGVDFSAMRKDPTAQFRRMAENYAREKQQNAAMQDRVASLEGSKRTEYQEQIRQHREKIAKEADDIAEYMAEQGDADLGESQANIIRQFLDDLPDESTAMESGVSLDDLKKITDKYTQKADAASVMTACSMRSSDRKMKDDLAHAAYSLLNTNKSRRGNLRKTRAQRSPGPMGRKQPSEPSTASPAPAYTPGAARAGNATTEYDESELAEMSQNHLALVAGGLPTKCSQREMELAVQSGQRRFMGLHDSILPSHRARFEDISKMSLRDAQAML